MPMFFDFFDLQAFVLQAFVSFARLTINLQRKEWIDELNDGR